MSKAPALAPIFAVTTISGSYEEIYTRHIGYSLLREEAIAEAERLNSLSDKWSRQIGMFRGTLREAHRHRVGIEPHARAEIGDPEWEQGSTYEVVEIHALAHRVEATSQQEAKVSVETTRSPEVAQFLVNGDRAEVINTGTDRLTLLPTFSINGQAIADFSSGIVLAPGEMAIFLRHEGVWRWKGQLS